MGRPLRASEGGLVYHALNRGNARLTIFDDDEDYAAFVLVLSQAVDRSGIRLLSYCVMPDHFHLVVWPVGDGDLSRFMRWLTLTHTQRWHAQRHSAGSGHVYQGRFQSFPVQSDKPLLTLCRYVESNALRAGLVARAEQWRWGSLWQRSARPSPSDAWPTLSKWPIERSRKWVARVNSALSPADEEAVRRSILRCQPFGASDWQSTTAARLGLESSLRPRGRPRKPRDGS